MRGIRPLYSRCPHPNFSNVPVLPHIFRRSGRARKYILAYPISLDRSGATMKESRKRHVGCNRPIRISINRVREVAFLFVAGFAPQAQAQCPNMCSGHGDCGAENVCNCFDGFDYAPDCSLRTWTPSPNTDTYTHTHTRRERRISGTCSEGVAWADKAYAIDLAHSLAECSNAGLCNRDTGKCECFDGYTGLACQRCICPCPLLGIEICSEGVSS